MDSSVTVEVLQEWTMEATGRQQRASGESVMQASTRRQHLETGVQRKLVLYERKARSSTVAAELDESWIEGSSRS